MIPSFRSAVRIALFLFPLIGCRSMRESTDNTTDPRWRSIDSLANIGQYASALEAVDRLREAAAEQGDWRTEFRTWVRKGEFQPMLGMEQTDWLMALGDRAHNAPVPLSQLLHSIRAEGWWNVYEGERWRILERTEVEGDGGPDPATWSQGRFMTEVIGAYRSSLLPADTLMAIPVGELGELLTGDPATRSLRTTLFDVLAHRALTTFTNDETRLAEPAWRFQLSGPEWFDLFEPFTFRKLTHRDSTSWEFQAIRLYQQLEHAHLRDDKLDAYVDVALARLAYVRSKSTAPDKETRYAAALDLLRSRLPYDACEAEVMVRSAQWHAERAEAYDRLANGVLRDERRKALALCDSALAKWPGSFGARNAAALRARLVRPTLQLQLEEAVAANKSFKIALTSANLKKVWFRIVADAQEEHEPRRWDNDRLQTLLASTPIQQWSVDLPDDGDMNEHLVELPVPALDHGAYALIVSSGPDFMRDTDVIARGHVHITDLAIVQRNVGTELDLLVLDRTTGKPKRGVEAQLLVRNMDHLAPERYLHVADLKTDSDGFVRTNLKDHRNEMRWRIRDGEDVYTTSPAWIFPQAEGHADSVRTYLFTDRGIYRPGQEVYVKGITIVERKGTYVVKQGHRAVLRFSDPNGEAIDTATVITDAFGAFHARFNVPVGGLSGSASLSTDHAQKQVLIEEYKRPTFEVVFDKQSTAPALGSTATVTGTAKSYAGAPLDGARVRYTVSRNAHMSWWCGWGWRGLPWGRPTEVATGEAVCNAEGKFKVEFVAAADDRFSREADPTFSFTIEAWATDISGETQTANTSFTIGYRTIDIQVGFGDALDRASTDSLHIDVRNLNGDAVQVPVEVKVARLQRPEGELRRERPWARPDRFVTTRSEHDARFPDEAYDGERDPATWPVRSEPVLVHRGTKGAFPWKQLKDLEVGTYRLFVNATDPNGERVALTKEFTLYDRDIQNTGFENEPFHVQAIDTSCEPGDKATLLLSSAAEEVRVLMEVEREGGIVVRRPFLLNKGQQRVELPVLESDRGGFAVHFTCVERGRDHSATQWVEVPWSNKELKVEWMSFRDKVLPGAKEEWRLRITGPKKEKVAAQVLAAMYDASLDRFATPEWSMDPWPNHSAQRAWRASEPMGLAFAETIDAPGGWVADSTRDYVRLVDEDRLPRPGYYRSTRGGVLYAMADMDASGATEGMAEREDANGISATPEKVAEARTPAAVPSPLRTDFRETAFFFPDLLTDTDGNVVLRFTMPDALTRWNFMGLAHTKDLRSVRFDRSTVTQKPMMIVPNLPRFLRQGDRIVLTAKINVVEGPAINGTARLELYDPRTNKSVTTSYTARSIEKSFRAAPGSSARVAWEIEVPLSAEAVAVRMVATAAGRADGEEHVLPVLSDRLLVTESIPLAINKAGTKTFTLTNLLNAGTSNTLQHRSLTLEFTPNPAWYAVQALPYLMEFPHECAEQLFSRYYANHLAAHIVGERPTMKKVFQAWGSGQKGNEGAFLSALDKNPQLKGVVLEETPWLLNAKDERERKRRIALFFDLNRMANEETTALNKLQEMQLPSGAWSWWSGMQPSRYITQHIVAGFAHLQQLGAWRTDPDAPASRMVENAVRWLDQEVEETYQRELKRIKDGGTPSVTAEDIHYVYARSAFERYPLERKKNSAVHHILQVIERDWLKYGLQEQAMIAMALHRLEPRSGTPALVLESLAQRATMSDELGMYWKDFTSGYLWNQLPIETHALMIEAFDAVGKDRTRVEALRQYLLKLKQTSDWKTTKATADACYALLLTGDDLLGPKSAPRIEVGGKPVDAEPAEAGTGYFQRTWQGTDVQPKMAQVSVTTQSDGVQWGALHWQYLERMDKVPSNTDVPFTVRRQVMQARASDTGTRLVPLAEEAVIAPGDKVTVRIELRTDRPLELVHLKDLHAAGTDAVEALSGYRWKAGLGYYQSVRDAAMHFFFDRIPPGTHVFEYDLKVTHAGTFSSGLATVQCMYAPEFNAHSEGLRVKVKD